MSHAMAPNGRSVGVSEKVLESPGKPSTYCFPPIAAASPLAAERIKETLTLAEQAVGVAHPLKTTWPRSGQGVRPRTPHGLDATRAFPAERRTPAHPCAPEHGGVGLMPQRGSARDTLWIALRSLTSAVTSGRSQAFISVSSSRTKLGPGLARFMIAASRGMAMKESLRHRLRSAVRLCGQTGRSQEEIPGNAGVFRGDLKAVPRKSLKGTARG
jgi:hypothetical protein